MSVIKKYNKEVENNMITPVDKQKQSIPNPTFSNTNFNVDNPSGLANTNPVPYERKALGSALVDTFDKTSLDLENPKPVGGPNRTTATNIPAGTYQVATSEGPLLYNKTNLQGLSDGQIVNQAVHQDTPENTYLDRISKYKNNYN